MKQYHSREFNSEIVDLLPKDLSLEEIKKLTLGFHLQVPKCLLKCKEIKPLDVLVYGHLLDHTHDHWEGCFPSELTMAHEFNSSESSIRRSITRLKKNEFIIYDKIGLKNNYTITLKAFGYYQKEEVVKITQCKSFSEKYFWKTTSQIERYLPVKLTGSSESTVQFDRVLRKVPLLRTNVLKTECKKKNQKSKEDKISGEISSSLGKKKTHTLGGEKEKENKICQKGKKGIGKTKDQVSNDRGSLMNGNTRYSKWNKKKDKVDPTEGLMFSKSKTNGRKKNLTHDLKDKMDEIKNYMKEISDDKYPFATQEHLKNLIHVFNEDMDEVKKYIQWSVSHWKTLFSEDSKLDLKPNLNNIVTPWRISLWRRKMMERNQTHLRDQKTQIKETKLASLTTLKKQKHTPTKSTL